MPNFILGSKSVDNRASHVAVWDDGVVFKTPFRTFGTSSSSVIKIDDNILVIV